MSCGGGIFGYHGRGLFNNRHHHSEDYPRRSEDYYRQNRQPMLEETNRKSKALDILDEKFVTGEITEEEYLRKKKIILSNIAG
ncbi:SHOCT domain-containing protein [Marinitoga aeolica]|uniref:SHOCT domain-containing protein n=1 Tax=Marinitoga aeolica TaxID=2809031 RepID=A0ABY8PTE6_9BACT|nr:SHOCT domain-containing protein [Marinitoga aeolica]WGS65921.1 SHOCT domain-containing protein [Marinitoga aeolica]